MDKQFVYLNFHTEYSSTGTLNKEMEREYCFSDVFWGESHQNNTYEIMFYLNDVALKDGAKNNACFLTKEELSDYISLAKNIYDFEFTITDSEDKKDALVVELTINGPRIAHRYILTWVRYAYEFPFNMYLMDAMRLKKMDEFKDDDIFNLFNLVGATSGYSFHGDRIHCIGDISWPRKFYTLEERIKTLKKSKATGEVNDLFPKLNITLETLYNGNKNFKSNLQCLEYWQSEDYFNERVPYYISAKQTIINTK